jgi:hypothetical protein
MVGRATETALAALNLGLVIEQMCWPDTEENYAGLRGEAERLIGEIGVGDVVIPPTQDEFTAHVGAVTTPSQERGRILGDTIALPLFFLHSFALRYAVQAAFGNADAELKAEVADFRAESRAASERLEQLIAQGNADVMGALGELQAALVQQAGVDPQEAAELTEGDPPKFWRRLLRWLGGAQARDAAEAALWTALDFVPAGTGVKLGIKVAGAIRRSLKDGG